MATVASLVAVLQLVVSPEAVLPDVPIAALVREVRSIWAPHVDVVVTMPGTPVRVADYTVELRTADRGPERDSPADADAGSLGWIAFVNGDEPLPVITVSPARARALMANAAYLGQPLRTLPSGLLNRLTAVALGRTIAHEIGHYLLRSPAHAPTGLMRASVRPQHMLDHASQFRLTAGEVAALQARLALASAESRPMTSPPAVTASSSPW